MKHKREIRTIAVFRWWYLLFLGAALLLLAGFYLDSAAETWIAQHQVGAVRDFMENVSRYGDWPGHIAAGSILLGLAYWRASKKWMRIFAAMLIACALAGVATRVIKISTGRARPNVPAEAEWNGPQLSARYNAFPSGHTASSTAFFAMLAIATWRIGVGFLAIPLLIAFSRVYVGAHHLSDVICAAILGMLAAYFVGRWILPGILGAKAEAGR